MRFFNNLFGKKNHSTAENEQIMETPPDTIKNLKARDKHRDPFYFYNFLERIKPTTEWLLNGYVDAKNNNNKVGIKNWSKGLSEGLYTMPSIWYSMGESIDMDWQRFYLEYIVYYQNCINKDLINGGYQFSSKILAIGILLNIDKNVFEKISERYIEEGYTDFILDSLIHFQYPSHPIVETLQFPKETYIQRLSAILRSTSKQEAEATIKDTLENHFYCKETLQAAYRSHKTEFYVGYWAWELAAMVKVMELDDNSFKDSLFYPYDMVHWITTKTDRGVELHK